MNDQIVTLEEQAVQAVREAGALLADPAAVRSIRAKSETDYVTNVDVAVQEFLRERLAVLAPDGSPLSLCQGGPLLASNGRLHSALQTILKE